MITIKTLCGMPLTPFASQHDRFANRAGKRSISQTVIAVALEEYFSSPILNRVRPV